jgi:hypothetical protein
MTSSVKTPPMDDDVSIDELQKAVEHMHGVPARFVEAVEVDERHDGQPIWQGAVKVFDVTGHPSGATRAFGLRLRRELPSLPSSHEQLLAHLRAFGVVHKPGGGSGSVFARKAPPKKYAA